ncbi:protein lethal(2)essential for life-like [Vanessa tameamea]|uniref:Protein lethal(2)essential for life-like n=1 Tax=Vanessa tameamea TaxID=334116 RepID=A0A8B8HR52_VANTA|nr:protein lethal(2)essential for life-like [Vanessa tameamea]
MAFHPFFVDPHPRRLMEQNFGLGLTPNDILTIVAVPQTNRNYYRPWRNLQATEQDSGSTIKEEKDKFQVNLDVQHFAPEEISVKTADGFLIIEAKHEERKDEHGFIARSFTRRYRIPDGIQEDCVTSKLSSDGVLSITAPLKAPPKVENERVVPIIQTGPVKKTEEGQNEN